MDKGASAMSKEAKALWMVREAKVISYDTETTGLTKNDRPCGYVISDGLESLYIPTAHAGGANIARPKEFEKELAKAFKVRTGWTIGHNLAFDLRMSRYSGIVLNKKLLDTQINEGLIDDHTTSYSLASCAERHGVTAKKGMELYIHLSEQFGGKASSKQMGNFYKLPGDDPLAVEYAEGDGITTYQLAEKQQIEMMAQELDRVLDLECQLIWYIDEMRARGMKIAMHLLEETRNQVYELQNLAASRLPPGFNSRSPIQVKQLFVDSGVTSWPLTPTGKPSFREKWLATNIIGQNILQVRQYSKLEESFIKPIAETYNNNGRVHAELNQSRGDEYGTNTGRLSCSNPNLQAFPKRNEDLGKIVRALVIPDTGMVLHEDDFSQQEPRLFAHYADDPNLLKGYASDPVIDVHAMTAELIGLPRSISKRLAMGMFTGMGVKALAGHMDCDEETARKYHQSFFVAYPKIRKFQTQATQKAEAVGYVKTALGRRARFPDRNFAYKATSRIIQGTGADHTKLALLNACKFAEASGNTINMLMTVHDSFIYQATIHADVEGLRREIERAADQLGFKLPIPLDHGEGANWAEASYG